MRNRDSLEWLLTQIEGKRVLYVGTVDDDPDNARKHPPVHRALARRAQAVTGIYRSEAQAAALRAEGLEALAADPEELELGKRFDRVVALDTLEHLANAGRFFAAMDRHLHQPGAILITTPNPASLVRIGELLLRGRSKVNQAHTCWYTGAVLDQLARRFGFRVIEEILIDEMHKYHGSVASRSGGVARRLRSGLLIGINRSICRVFPQLSETFGFVLARDSAAP